MGKALQFAVAPLTLTAVSDHPNKMRFRGILVRLDEASTKAPNGSNGHRILVPSDVARDKLQTLVGMGLNYAPTLDGHAQRRKVGVITKAWIEGQNLRVEGHVWKHDFPEAEKDLKQPDLGMSMELGEVRVEDPDSPVWKLTDFSFLGATILKRKAAAYFDTAAIAAQAHQERSQMSIKKKVVVKPAGRGSTLDGTQIAEIAANAASAAVQRTLAGVINRQTEILASLSARMEQMEIGAEVDAEETEEEGTPVADLRTKKKVAAEEDVEAGHEEPDGDEFMDEEEDEEEMESEVDKGSLQETGPDTADPGDDTPGHISEQAKNKGSKNSSEDKTGANVNKAVTGSAVAVLRKQVRKLTAAVEHLTTENKTLKGQLSRTQKQVTAAATKLERRSVPGEVLGLLSKHNIDAQSLLASGSKLSVGEVDAVLASVGNLDVVKRMELKNAFHKAGLMDDGVVDRGFGLGR